MSLDLEKNTTMTSKIVPLTYRKPINPDDFGGPNYPSGTVIGIRLLKEEGTTLETIRTNLYYVLGVFEEDDDQIEILEEDENLFNSRITDQTLKRIDGFSDVSDFEPSKRPIFINGAIQIPTRIIDKYDNLLGI